MSGGGFSDTRLARLHEVMAGYVERGEVAGLTLLVSRRGRVHVDTLGSLALDGQQPIERDTIFRIASMSKPVVAVAALILVEECRLRLDDPLDRYLPELAARRVLKRLDGPLEDTVPAERPITLRDLLTFRMGFGTIMAAASAYPIQRAVIERKIRMGPPLPQEHLAPDEWMRNLGALPLMTQPGERWMYDTAADVLSVLIARVAGQPLETFLRERLFEPLGMVDTAFSVPAEKIARLATCYRPHLLTGALELYDAPTSGQWTTPPTFPSGGAGLVSTVDDYHAFGRMLLSGGRHGNARILSRPTIEAMVTDQLTTTQRETAHWIPGYFRSHGWGLGVSIVTGREEPWGTIGQFGWDGGLGTSWHSDPQENLVGILMTQRAWMSPKQPKVVQDFWTAVYQAIDD